MKKIYFISGIDTDCGKTVVTGLLARYASGTGINVITQKMVQTGCAGIAEDILEHRRIMGIAIQEVDEQMKTCPYIFKHPASPHLAAKMENAEISPDIIEQATAELCQSYDLILLEGAGGLFVPLNETICIIDYLQARNYPLILVTSSKLGSINHTLMSLEICKKRNISVKALIYNHYPANDQLILNNSMEIFKTYLQNNFPGSLFFEVPKIEDASILQLDFNGLF